MIDFTAIRDVIFTGLNDYLNVLVVEANQTARKPPYPYITILFGGPLSTGQGHTGSIYIKDNGDADIDYTRAKNEVLTLSITSISDTGAEAQQNAVNASEWFKWQGELYLKEHHIIPIAQEAMTNRDTYLTDDWEKRVGFDLRLRVLSQTTRPMEWIGQIERTRKDGSTEMMDLNMRDLL